MGSWTAVSFSEVQQAQFAVDAEGKVTTGSPSTMQCDHQRLMRRYSMKASTGMPSCSLKHGMRRAGYVSSG